MSLEVFRPIKNFEDYEVSNWGNVYSKRTHKMLKPFITGKGYLKVNLNVGGKRIHCRVHRLVAQAFIPNPQNKPQVNHIDGNKLNNSFTNLEWCTNQENVSKAYAIMKIQREEQMTLL